jgi:hypothetical protein
MSRRAVLVSSVAVFVAASAALPVAAQAPTPRIPVPKFRGHLRIRYQARGEERFQRVAVRLSEGGDCNPTERTDMTETFNWSYSWAPISIRKLATISNNYESAALAYDGGPGRIRGTWSETTCVNGDRGGLCDAEIDRKRPDSGAILAFPSRAHTKVGITLVPAYPEAANAGGNCWDVLQVSHETGGPAVGQQFMVPLVLDLKALSRAKPGFKLVRTRPGKQRADVTCTAHRHDVVVDPCRFHLRWSGTVTVTRLP